MALLGSVNSPAIYELRGESSVSDLLALAGGRTNTAAGNVVRLERISEHELRSVLYVDLATAPETPLRNGGRGDGDLDRGPVPQRRDSAREPWPIRGGMRGTRGCG